MCGVHVCVGEMCVCDVCVTTGCVTERPRLTPETHTNKRNTHSDKDSGRKRQEYRQRETDRQTEAVRLDTLLC